MRLSTAVGLAVLTGAMIAAVAEWVLFAVFHPQRGGTSVDVTKLALTVVGGVGGVVALVIAYRRQRDLEQGRFVERFGAAAAQLGASDVAVRIAGVYAMVGVADESDGLRRQQCIDVLCGYLRLPYDAAHGSSGRTKRVVTVPNPRVVDLEDPGKIEEHHEYRNNDREVRATIVRVIAAHLRPEAEYNWSANNFDFRTAYLEDANFDRATFSGTTWFDGATFSDTAWFGGAIFSGTAWFGDATFSGAAWFEGATFSGAAWFGGATFSGTAQFDRTTFSGTARFGGAAFFGTARFSDANFSDTASFGNATFSDTARLDGATFSGTASFDGATFSSGASFRYTTFCGTAQFGGAAFYGACTFVKADFGVQPISFVAPQRWGPPEPVFDWSVDITLKPTNVDPQDWPPIVTAPLTDSR